MEKSITNDPGSNGALRPWVGGSGTQVTHSVYNSIIMYTLKAVHWTYWAIRLMKFLMI